MENGLFDNSATKVPKCMPCNLGAGSGREAISGVRKCAYYKGDESAITLKVAQKYRWLHATSCQNSFTKIGGNCHSLN